MILKINYRYSEEDKCNVITSFEVLQNNPKLKEINCAYVDIRDIPTSFYTKWYEFTVEKNEVIRSARLVSKYSRKN